MGRRAATCTQFWRSLRYGYAGAWQGEVEGLQSSHLLLSWFVVGAVLVGDVWLWLFSGRTWSRRLACCRLQQCKGEAENASPVRAWRCCRPPIVHWWLTAGTCAAAILAHGVTPLVRRPCMFSPGPALPAFVPQSLKPAGSVYNTVPSPCTRTRPSTTRKSWSCFKPTRTYPDEGVDHLVVQQHVDAVADFDVDRRRARGHGRGRLSGQCCRQGTD